MPGGGAKDKQRIEAVRGVAEGVAVVQKRSSAEKLKRSSRKKTDGERLLAGHLLAGGGPPGIGQGGPVISHRSPGQHPLFDWHGGERWGDRALRKVMGPRGGVLSERKSSAEGLDNEWREVEVDGIWGGGALQSDAGWSKLDGISILLLTCG